MRPPKKLENILTIKDDVMKTRHATADDGEAIAKLLATCYNMKGVEEAQETLMKEQASFTYIVAEDQLHGIIGLISWKMHGTPKHGLCELNRIAVLPHMRKNGTGRALFEALQKDAENFFITNGSQLRKIFLFSHETNDGAKKFYESIGFRKEAVLQNHYYEGVDEAVYSMFL